MSAFDKIIGYDHIKAELMQISDMIHHPEVYAALDAKLPQGLLLSGAPGLGKTLMATALMEDSGLPCFTVRRSQSEDDFLKQLAHTFDEAAEAAPSMLLLDDMDKFSSDEFSRVYSGAELHRQGAGEAGFRDRHRQQCGGAP